MEKLKLLVYRQLSRQLFRDDTELFLYLTLLTASGYAGVIYLVLFLFHLALGMPVFATLTGVLLLVSLAGIPLVRRRRAYTAVGLLITLGTILNATAVTVLAGINSYAITYYFLLLVLQVIIPYAHKRVRIAAGVTVWLCMLGAMALGFTTGPLGQIDRGRLIVLGVFNLNLTLLGVVVELLVIDLIRKGIELYNATLLSAAEEGALTDPLTGLHNRRYAQLYFDSLRRERPPGSLVVALVDVDDFKAINDRYGHDVGDKVLRHTAAMLRRSLRRSDMVCRWGGEEFLLVLQDVEEHEAARILDALRARVAARPVAAGGESIPVTVTLGLAALDPFDPYTGVKKSDEKLYEGKRRGKNRVVG